MPCKLKQRGAKQAQVKAKRRQTGVDSVVGIDKKLENRTRAIYRVESRRWRGKIRLRDWHECGGLKNI
eukprot:6211867-Pleurochrysis_carterae.AAC.2